MHSGFRSETARATYKLGCVLQDMGSLAQGRSLIEDAETLRKELVAPENWEPASNEDPYDGLIICWSR
jgi:hypothetical protein